MFFYCLSDFILKVIDFIDKFQLKKKLFQIHIKNYRKIFIFKKKNKNMYLVSIKLNVKV